MYPGQDLQSYIYMSGRKMIQLIRTRNVFPRQALRWSLSHTSQGHNILSQKIPLSQCSPLHLPSWISQRLRWSLTSPHWHSGGDKNDNIHKSTSISFTLPVCQAPYPCITPFALHDTRVTLIPPTFFYRQGNKSRLRKMKVLVQKTNWTSNWWAPGFNPNLVVQSQQS